MTAPLARAASTRSIKARPWGLARKASVSGRQSGGTASNSSSSERESAGADASAKRSGTSVEQLGQRGTRIRLAHEGLAHQEGVHVGGAHAPHVRGAQDAGLGHPQGGGRDPRQQAQRGLEPDLEGAQV